MRLKRARVTKFRSIDDSTWVDAEDVLALVGKNESGKTTFLQALEKLNPAETGRGDFNPVKDFPRREYSKYKKQHDSDPAKAVEAEFELSNTEVLTLEGLYGKGILSDRIVTISKNHKNRRDWNIRLSEQAALQQEAKRFNLPSEVAQLLKKSQTLAKLLVALDALSEKTPATVKFAEELRNKFPKGIWDKVVNDHLVKMLPRFVYFGDYNIMDGTINLQALKQRDSANPRQVNESDRTFLSLLAMADTSLDDLQNNQAYEALKAELEATSAGITDDVFEYWTQNKQLRVEFDIMQANGKEAPPFNTGTNLYVRVWNDRHRVSVPFNERSRGFVWFFSFLAYFSQLDGSPGSLILLLDEPGLNLHATAQSDFLRFIDERLASKYQVLYTTHSPFMVPAHRLERVRTVQDLDGMGTVISKDVLKNDKDTLFPLQAALGYDLAQTLFIGPNNLLVEGPSDIIYLQLLGRVAEQAGREGIAREWSIVPAGGADKVSTFVTLMGSQRLNLAVLMDVAAKDRQRIDNLKSNQLLGQSALVQVNEAIDQKDADIEDIFDPAFYLALVNGAYSGKLESPIELKDLPNTSVRIVKRLERYFEENAVAGGHFNHYLPAEFLLREQAALLKGINEKTLERFAIIARRINGLLVGTSPTPGRSQASVRSYRRESEATV